jgi:HAMP domain-containing protein
MTEHEPARREAEEFVRIVQASVREAWQAYALQFQEGARPTREAMEAILARSAYPILAKLEALPLEALPTLVSHVVRGMLTAFLQVTREELAREHQRMLDTLEREALKFADRASRAIEDANQARAAEVARLAAEVERLRQKLEPRRPR